MSGDLPPGAVKVGELAPDFTLPTHNEGDLNLAWYRGRRQVVLAFYPGDWTPVCATHIALYQPLQDRMVSLGTQLLCVSVDSIPSHIAWAKSMGGFSFPLMSDFFPHGRVAALYGSLSARGYAERSVFVIDAQGIVRDIERIGFADLPDIARMFRTLEKYRPVSSAQSGA